MTSRSGGKRKIDGADIEDGEISATIDLELLDCPICFEPLRSPLFQCQNGHVACSSCGKKLQDKCPSCTRSINFSRCLLLEKVIESIKVPCSYATDGCKAMISCGKQVEHEDVCIYTQCVCPMPNCNFSGSTKLLSTHVGTNHQAYVRSVHQPFTLRRDVPLCFVLGYGEVFLLLNQKVGFGMWNGNSLSVLCIRPRAPKPELLYYLRVWNSENSLELKGSVKNVKEWKGRYPTIAFLFVPKDLCTTLTVACNFWAKINV